MLHKAFKLAVGNRAAAVLLNSDLTERINDVLRLHREVLGKIRDLHIFCHICHRFLLKETSFLDYFDAAISSLANPSSVTATAAGA